MHILDTVVSRLFKANDLQFCWIRGTERRDKKLAFQNHPQAVPPLVPIVTSCHQNAGPFPTQCFKTYCLWAGFLV